MTWRVVFKLTSLPLLLLGVSLVLFLISQILPADPARLILGDSAQPSALLATRERLGLDQPLPVQYVNYLSRLMHGDLGESIRFSQPVTTLIAQAFPATFQLIVGAAIFGAVLAFPLGILSAAFRDTWIDVLARVVSSIGGSAPPFFLAILFILIFAFQFRWFPIAGRGDPPDLSHMVLPAAVLALRSAGSTARLLRASLIETMSREHIFAARARGIPESSIFLRYALRNALIPAVTDFGVTLADMVGSVIFVETIFAWPGIGQLVYLGIRWNDFPLLSGAIMVLVVYAVAANTIVDLLYGWIDPRMRLA